MATTIETGLNTLLPVSMTQAQDGDLYIANGLQRPQRWTGSGSSMDAGITAPSATECADFAAAAAGSDAYTVYVRYIDSEGKASNFSPAESLTADDGNAVTLTNIPVATTDSSRVTGREIWINTAGQQVTWYMVPKTDDIATIAGNNSTTTASFTLSESALLASDSIRLYTSDGFPNANRFLPPPDFMTVVASYQDRMWYGVPVVYTSGTVSIENEATTLYGSGTLWTDDLVGQTIRIDGNTVLIETFTNNEEVEIAEEWTPASVEGVKYAVSADDAYRQSIFFSEAGEPESVPAENMITLQVDGDSITGMFPYGPYLYIFKHRHIYRLTTSGNPRQDAGVALVSGRGALNQRCICLVDDVIYAMDDQGAYAFDGNSTKPIDDNVRDIFRDTVDWSTTIWFHVGHVPDASEVRFYVCAGTTTAAKPENALVYNYRNGRWAWDEYPWGIPSSSTMVVDGQERGLLGAVGKTILMANEGYEDDTTSVTWEAKFGAFQYVDMSTDNPRHVSLQWEPTSTTETATVKYYHNYSTDAETNATAFADGRGVTKTNGAEGTAIALRAEDGFAQDYFYGGFEEHGPASRVLEVGITGTTDVSVEIYGIQIAGVTG